MHSALSAARRRPTFLEAGLGFFYVSFEKIVKNSFAKSLTCDRLCFRGVFHHLGQCTSIWRNRIGFLIHRLPSFLGDDFNRVGIDESGAHCVPVACLMDFLVTPVRIFTACYYTRGDVIARTVVTTCTLVLDNRGLTHRCERVTTLQAMCLQSRSDQPAKGAHPIRAPLIRLCQHSTG